MNNNDLTTSLIPRISSHLGHHLRHGRMEGAITFCQQGCGCNKCMGTCADVLEEYITPVAESTTRVICCLGSPLALPLIYCFDADPHTHETSGWNVTVTQAPKKAPFVCCINTLCMPCGQFYIRKHVILNGDMTQYKLWQKKHDGKYCLAKYCKDGPCTIEGGTHGEENCPNVFLCAEVTCLGCGICSPCCAFDVHRDIMKEELSLGTDPTEARFEKCQGFFGELMSCAACSAWHLRIVACCLGNIATESEGAQELTGEARRLSHACGRLSRVCFRGLVSVRIMLIGCMSSQMVHEHRVNAVSEAPQQQQVMRD